MFIGQKIVWIQGHQEKSCPCEYCTRHYKSSRSYHEGVITRIFNKLYAPPEWKQADLLLDDGTEIPAALPSRVSLGIDWHDEWLENHHAYYFVPASKDWEK